MHLSTSLRGQAGMLLGGAGLGTALLVARPPVDGAYPACPWLAITGMDCPFCGGLRSVAALAHGDLATAVDYNVLVAVGVPMALLAAVAVLMVGSRLAPAVTAVFSRPAQVAMASVVGVFFVVRMLPIAPWLTSSA